MVSMKIECSGIPECCDSHQVCATGCGLAARSPATTECGPAPAWCTQMLRPLISFQHPCRPGTCHDRHQILPAGPRVVRSVFLFFPTMNWIARHPAVSAICFARALSLPLVLLQAKG